jgi:hypothetical protein
MHPQSSVASVTIRSLTLGSPEHDDEQLAALTARGADLSLPLEQPPGPHQEVAPAFREAATLRRYREVRRRLRRAPLATASSVRADRASTRPMSPIPRARETRSARASRDTTTSGDDPPGEPALPPPSRRPALRRRATTVAFRARLAGGLTPAILAEATTDLSDTEREYVLAWVPPFVRETQS